MAYGFEIVDEGIHLLYVCVGACSRFTTGLDPVLILRLHFQNLMSFTPEIQYGVHFLLELLCNEPVGTEVLDGSNKGLAMIELMVDVNMESTYMCSSLHCWLPQIASAIRRPASTITPMARRTLPLFLAMLIILSLS